MPFPMNFWIVILYFVVILCLTAVMIVALVKIEKGHSTSLRKVFEQTQFLKLATVLVIIISATCLQLEDKLSEGIIGILSGIAGYVLGGLGYKKEEDNVGGEKPIADK